jgi:hypothetical protein
MIAVATMATAVSVNNAVLLIVFLDPRRTRDSISRQERQFDFRANYNRLACRAEFIMKA